MPLALHQGLSAYGLVCTSEQSALSDFRATAGSGESVAVSFGTECLNVIHGSREWLEREPLPGGQASAERPPQKARSWAHGAAWWSLAIGPPSCNPEALMGPRIAVARGYHVHERASRRVRLW